MYFFYKNSLIIKLKGKRMKTKIGNFEKCIRENTEGPKDSVLSRAMGILYEMSSATEALSSISISEKLKLPKASVHRLMLQLEVIGLLEREPGSKKFITSQRLNELALQTLINSPQKSTRHAILEKLVADLNETCNITMLSGHNVIYVDRVESQWPLRIHLQPGSKVPIYCGASGKLLLSYMPALKRKKILRSIALVKFTENTVIELEKIEKELKKTKIKDYGLDVEEFMHGLIGIAVPIFKNNKICGTVSIHIPTVRHSIQDALAYIPRMRIAANEISLTLS